MDVDAARFVRHLLLPEIGDAGQARILGATAPVGGEGLEHEVAGLYARGAGFAAVNEGPVDVDRLAPRALVTNDGARAVLAASRAALAALHAALARVSGEDAP